MIDRRTGIAALAAVAWVLLAAGAALAQQSQRQPQEEYPGGYLKYTYRMQAGAANLAETTTTEITPTANGQYQVVTTTQETASAEQIRLGFFGFSLRWLGLYVREDTSGRIDLSPLDALADQGLEPQKKYLLPDGGLLQTADRVTIAGLSGVEGTYLQADVPNVKITLVLADDLEVRRLLPFPLRVKLEYTQPAGTTSVDGTPAPGTRFSGMIELVEYKRIE
jgi:hypothetical protein